MGNINNFNLVRKRRLFPQASIILYPKVFNDFVKLYKISSFLKAP